MLINPIAYKLGSSICCGLAVLPLDIIQTNMMSSKNVEFHMEEFKMVIINAYGFSITKHSIYQNSEIKQSSDKRGYCWYSIITFLYFFTGKKI